MTVVCDGDVKFPEMTDDGFPGVETIEIAYGVEKHAKPVPREEYLDVMERRCDTWDLGCIFHSYGDGRTNYTAATGAAAMVMDPAAKDIETHRVADTDSV